MSLKDEAIQTFELYLKDPKHVTNMVATHSLKVSKEVEFVIESLIAYSKLPDNLELYSADVNMVVDIYNDVKFQFDRKRVEFYDEIRYRYIDIIKSCGNDIKPVQVPTDPLQLDHLYWMLEELGHDDMSETKKHRWLGYVQGVMTVFGMIDVQEERNYTREIFRGK